MSEIKLSLMTQHSSLSSLSEYEFNKKSPKMIHHSIILNSTHLAKTLFMESPGFINFLGRKSIVTQMINLDYASLVFVMCGARVLDYWLQNSKELLPSPVRKCSDAEQGNREHTINNNNPNSNVPYGNVPNWLANEMDITENSTHGNRDGGGGGGSGGGGGGSDGGSGVPAQFIEIHRITVDSSNGGSVSRSPIIYTNIFASEYHSWAGISRAIHYIWLGHEGYNDNDDNNNNNDNNNNSSNNNNNSNNNSNVRQDYSPLNCWPGSLVYFGRYEGNAFRQYHWFLNAWEDVKEKLSVVIVLKNR